ncbi:NUDIX hydrolase [Parafrankia colletiae]|uniref:NUDIX hydrolase n=1 Tax=Parafrankia colletiae TaxID=573497 RepID=A0A1S1QGT5_9ACTN|nr:NUDIX domain-containing protein [Parafrankia colletiae]MCK9901925.1 NUDIX domain-containing protein [Frankia sp. Cpl3]OHV32877.1 NUDIX hydrolase [Parafrankia colletiae]
MSAHPSFPLSRRDFDDIYGRVPRLCVEVVIREPDGVLLVRRDIEPARGQWHLPGGTVLFGESLPAAVARVAGRELGVTVAAGELLGYVEYPLIAASGYRGWPVGLAFAATIVSGHLVGSDEGRQIGWFRDIPSDTIGEQADFLRQLVALPS